MAVGFVGWLGLAAAAVVQVPNQPLLLMLLIACASLAEYWPAKVRAGTISILTAFIIPSAALTGSVGTAIMLAVASLAAAASHRRPLFIGFFNGGQFVLSVLVSRLVVFGISGTSLSGTFNMGWLLLFYVVFLVVNHVIVDMYFLLAGYSWHAVVWDALSLDVIQSLITVPLGFAIIYADRSIGWLGVLGVALPVITLGYALSLQTALSQRNRNLETLYGLQGKFARAHGVSDILHHLCESIAESLSAHQQFAATVAGRSEFLSVPGSTFSVPEQVLHIVATDRQRLIFEGQAQAGVLYPSARSGVVLPVQAGERMYGVLSFAWLDQRAFSDQDQHLLDASAQIAALACEKEELLRATERLAATDPRLPGLYNHRYFMAQLTEEIARLGRESEVLGLLYIDLDGFKACNDRYGHLAGDEALREFAAIMRTHTRQNDVAARYAGDEFALLLPDAGEELSQSIATRLRREVEDFRFLRSESDGGVHLSFSYGIATTRSSDTAPASLVEEADRAMYRDKEDGKQGVRSAPQRDPR